MKHTVYVLHCGVYSSSSGCGHGKYSTKKRASGQVHLQPQYAHAIVALASLKRVCHKYTALRSWMIAKILADSEALLAT